MANKIDWNSTPHVIENSSVSSPVDRKKISTFDDFVNGGFDGPYPDVIVNESGLIPCGHRIVVKIEEVERQTESGIIIKEDTADREEMSAIKATVVAVGPSAWADQSVSGTWAKVGDKIMIAKFAGQLWKRNGSKYRVISDLDVIAVIKSED